MYFARTPAEKATVVRYVASHVIRRSRPEKGEHLPPFTKAVFDEIVRRPLPTAAEQRDLLIVWMGDRLPFPESRAWLPFNEVSAAIGAGKGSEGLTYIWNELERQGLVQGGLAQSSTGTREYSGGLTFAGWAAYQNLKAETRDSRTGFMAMSFNHAASGKMYNDTFVPAAAEAGFALRRVDSIAQPGLIDVKMMVEIRAAAFLVADLTGHSHGAYWEAGFAAGLGKPVIYTCEEADFKSPGTHFDVNHHTTILWDATQPMQATVAVTPSAFPRLSFLRLNH